MAADYYPLVAKAVGALEPNTGEGRRLLYERARSALVQQLRKMDDPPLTEAEISHERLALEGAIRKVEDEVAKLIRAELVKVTRARPDFSSDQSSSAPRESGGDPLAELARLIGQSDPFNDLSKRSVRKPDSLKNDDRPAPEWLAPPDSQAAAKEFSERVDQRAREARERAKAEAEAGVQRRKVILQRLSDAASPQPSLTPEGLLDAGPNPKFDVPTVDDDLSGLPVRQRTLIKVILTDLPRNSPGHLKRCLLSYDEELKVRGVQPILGLLQDMAGIIAAAVAAPDSETDWLSAGQREAFRKFESNHTTFVEHFPLDPEREELYAQTPVNEQAAAGETLTAPFETMQKASMEAHKEGLATDDFLAVIEKMTEFARVISTQPLAPPASSGEVKQPQTGAPEIKISPDDRLSPVTVKKRIILRALGFFERAYHLLSSSAQLAGPSEGNKILEALRSAIEMLSKLMQ